MTKFIKEPGECDFHSMVRTLCTTRPSSASRASGFPPLPSSHDFSDRIGFIKELLVMATLSKVLFCRWAE